MSLKLKRGTKDKIESALSDAMAQLEVEDSTSDDLKKKELALKRVVTKASVFFVYSESLFTFRYILPPYRRLLTPLPLECQPARLTHHLQKTRSKWRDVDA
jgi:hypothetical protein